MPCDSMQFAGVPPVHFLACACMLFQLLQGDDMMFKFPSMHFPRMHFPKFPSTKDFQKDFAGGSATMSTRFASSPPLTPHDSCSGARSKMIRALSPALSVTPGGARCALSYSASRMLVTPGWTG